MSDFANPGLALLGLQQPGTVLQLFRTGPYSSKPDSANPGLTEFFLPTFWPTNRTISTADQPQGMSKLKAACRGRQIFSENDSF